MARKHLFTSESVTEGHPDKVCDQISDAVLDELLRQDKASRVACETAVNTGLVLVMGEITTKGYADIAKIARQKIHDIGYNNIADGFNSKSCAVLLSVDEQSADIAMGVDKALESKTGDDKTATTGAGDQGMMFGFACNETKTLMPMPIFLAHNITRALAANRKNGNMGFLMPDGKAQVSCEYEDGVVKRIDTVVVSTQHKDYIDMEELRARVKAEIVEKTVPAEYLDENTKYFINPTGRFVIGGPQGDSGLTGRKIIVDTYGGYARHGGGAFSGKDPSKVDRSAAYYGRYVAKNIVAAGLAQKCEIAVAYAIGVAKPVSISVNTFGTGKTADDKIIELINKHFDFRPQAIIEQLDLLRPIYAQTAAYGHFGREDLDVPWEKTDKAHLL
ncbi:MAG: methionine adenosyltransferase [Clostridia bacterium]|nr:methionine adenosyltransferase [Clostridia bacterium]